MTADISTVKDRKNVDSVIIENSDYASDVDGHDSDGDGSNVQTGQNSLADEVESPQTIEDDGPTVTLDWFDRYETGEY